MLQLLRISITVSALALTASWTLDASAQVAPVDPAPAAVREVVRVESPVTRAQDQTAIPRHLRESVSALVIDETKWKALRGNLDLLIDDVPLGPNTNRSMILHRVDPFENQPKIVGAAMGRDGVIVETAIAVPALDCYVGSLLDEPQSRVLLSRGDGFTAGYVQHGGKTWVISSGRIGIGGPIVSYAMDEVPPGTFTPQPWSCEALLPPNGGGVGGADGGIASTQPCRQSRIAVETDVEFLALFGNNAASAAGYVGTLFAGLADIYSRDVNLRPGMCYLRLWTASDDPWTATTTTNQLYEFRDAWSLIPPFEARDSAAFLSGRGLGGGVAWLSAGCGEYAYSVSANLAGSFPYPLVDNSGANWDIMVVAHELGHNYGAPHTHDYSPPADGCGSNPQDCSAATNDQGTIMSYCHICPGGMANINLYFHPLSIGSIETYIGGTSCAFSATQQPPLPMPDRVTTMPATTIDIDVLQNDSVFNCEATMLVSITQPGQGSSAVIATGSNGRPVVRFTAAASGPTPAIFTYTLQDSSAAQGVAAVTVDIVSLRLPENPTGDTAGIATRYYELSSPQVLPNFDTLTPYSTTSVTQMNYASTNGNYATSNRADNVGAVYTGWLNVPTGGTWTLYTNSDDGSRLLIGTTQVVSNDGLHAMLERSGTIDLAAGKHAVRVEFFENGGGAGLIVSWSGPNTPKAVIPASALTKGGVVNRADINRDGIVNGTDLTWLLAAWGTAQADADINQDGAVNGTDLTVLLAGWSN